MFSKSSFQTGLSEQTSTCCLAHSMSFLEHVMLSYVQTVSFAKFFPDTLTLSQKLARPNAAHGYVEQN